VLSETAIAFFTYLLTSRCVPLNACCNTAPYGADNNANVDTKSAF